VYSHFLVFWFLRTLALRIFRYYVLWLLRTLASSYPGIFNNACIGMLVFPFPGTQVPAYFGTPDIALLCTLVSSYFGFFVSWHLLHCVYRCLCIPISWYSGPCVLWHSGYFVIMYSGIFVLWLLRILASLTMRVLVCWYSHFQVLRSLRTLALRVLRISVFLYYCTLHFWLSRRAPGVQFKPQLLKNILHPRYIKRGVLGLH